MGNFPVQANGAEMLRIAIGLMQNQGLRVCAPIHDAVLIEGPKRDELECLNIAQKCMRKASEAVLGGFTLNEDSKVIRAPFRYMDEERVVTFWNVVMTILGQPLYSSQ